MHAVLRYQSVADETRLASQSVGCQVDGVLGGALPDTHKKTVELNFYPDFVVALVSFVVSLKSFCCFNEISCYVVRLYTERVQLCCLFWLSQSCCTSCPVILMHVMRLTPCAASLMWLSA